MSVTRDLSLHHSIEISIEAHPASWAPRTLSPGVKQSRHEADLSTPSCAEINECSYTTTIPYAFTACTEIIHLYDTFTLFFVQHMSYILHTAFVEDTSFG